MVLLNCLFIDKSTFVHVRNEVNFLDGETRHDPNTINSTTINLKIPVNLPLLNFTTLKPQSVTESILCLMKTGVNKIFFLPFFSRD